MCHLFPFSRRARVQFCPDVSHSLRCLVCISPLSVPYLRHLRGVARLTQTLLPFLQTPKSARRARARTAPPVARKPGRNTEPPQWPRPRRPRQPVAAAAAEATPASNNRWPVPRRTRSSSRLKPEEASASTRWA